MVNLASKVTRATHAASSSSSSSADQPPLQKATSEQRPIPSELQAGKTSEPVSKRDHALPLTSEEIQLIKTVCGISDADGGEPSSWDYAAGNIRPITTGRTRGVLLTAWNLSLFDCVQEWNGLFSLTVLLKRKVDGRSFMISNIYGPTAAHLKADFFQELRSIKDFSTRVWTMLGDFNVLLSVEDKNGSTANVADILNFRKVVHDLGLVDLPILNKSFTWTNGGGAPTLERLDRAFISSNWLLAFPHSTLRALPRPHSYHTPLVLSTYSAHILVHHLYTSKRSAALLKINFEWAFDHINWCFLVDLLKARGFTSLWIAWIQALLNTANTSVILNGVPDVLFRMIQMATSSNLLPDQGIGDVRIQSLQFADDLLIFLDGSPRSAAATKLILDAFAACSGLKINYYKSS
uniref:Uncharacterized protein n=1 Tax=Ananas comosus var. bracteatus TaxID=296719 RepID=A0A6V7Q364_ANACO|nr:unnamed protein product [Ananas comosus var. bracteatus]